MKLFKLKKRCRSCKREFEKNELAISYELKNAKSRRGGLKKGLHDREITMPVANLLVCEACFFKLTEEQELRLNGLVKCQYCDTIHKTGQRCSTCGAPRRKSLYTVRVLCLLVTLTIYYDMVE